jgi:hypothetical protein
MGNGYGIDRHLEKTADCRQTEKENIRGPCMNKKEPNPVKNHHRAVWDLVVEDMKIRDAIGNEKYKTRLQPHNGRDPLRDAYQEALDLAVYLRQELFERYGV